VQPELCRVLNSAKPGTDTWVLKVVNVLLTVFRHKITVSTSLLNSLLQVLEQAFRKPCDEAREQAFRSWSILIDVFAEKSE
jgi:hypothetical protein